MKTKINTIIKILTASTFLVVLVLNVKLSLDDPVEFDLKKQEVMAEETTITVTVPCADLYSWVQGEFDIRVCLKDNKPHCVVESVDGIHFTNGTCSITVE